LLVNPSQGWVAVNQDTSTNFVMAHRNIGSSGGKLELIESDVAKDSFFEAPRLDAGEVFEPPFLIAQDTGANQLVVPMQLNGSPFNPFEPPSFEIHDLSRKTHGIFSPGLGSGSVMGVAIDSTTHMMCTTTSDDSNVEFIDLTSKSGFAENLPNGVGEGSGGGAVAVDELNHLFIVTQPAGVLKSASVYVYDEQGNLQESIQGFDFQNSNAAVFAYVAINPRLRIGYATSANSAQLQSFTY
jgi:DNA-binding beta-propeller fold protein YncE